MAGPSYSHCYKSSLTYNRLPANTGPSTPVIAYSRNRSMDHHPTIGRDLPLPSLISWLSWWCWLLCISLWKLRPFFVGLHKPNHLTSLFLQVCFLMAHGILIVEATHSRLVDNLQSLTCNLFFVIEPLPVIQQLSN